MGVSLGYRRNKLGGTWVLRVANGRGGAATQAIGTADDYDTANGSNILTFWQAQERAKSLARREGGAAAKSPLTTSQAAENYLESLAARNVNSARDARGRLRKHFLAHFGEQAVRALTKTALDRWLAGMVAKSSDPDKVRRSKDSANRVLAMVKALLNHALRDPSNGLIDDHAWRLVKSFKGVGEARRVHFSMQQAQKLIEATRDGAFADLLTAGFLTGARYGELIRCNVADYDSGARALTVDGKTGARTILLQPEAVSFFDRLVAERAADESIFKRKDGERWNRSQQQRRMAAALKQAKLDPEGTFYALRHTYISRAIEGQIPLNIIAKNCGTSVRMIEMTYAKVLAKKRQAFIDAGAPSFGKTLLVRGRANTTNV
ncbi:MAG: tyrosine-type recombinase/integrase [Hyphomicrobiales bacterium]|nr:tyrosine-type recombinase/integrase [Hyphomicrobiales bacterium]